MIIKFIKNKTRQLVVLFFIIGVSFIFTMEAFAAPNTLCNGKEFNRRVKAFLNNGDENIDVNWDVLSFERGNNPPEDETSYVDVSEDRDGSIVVYKGIDDINWYQHREEYDQYDRFRWKLYWYSPGNAIMNSNTAFMFDKFMGMKSIDLSGFTYLKGLSDARYMFLECRNLKTLKFKAPNAQQKFSIVEVQGMFYGCQSMTSIDLKLFDTHLVDNMDEMFCKCYNLKNLYVDKSIWNIESVRTFNRMFTDCMLLKTNKGRKAVDVADDDFEQFAVPGDDKVEGFCKDYNTTYADYGENDGYVPIDGRSYVSENPETIALYEDEPEGDGGAGNETGSGSGNGIIPYVGDKITQYNATKESKEAASVYAPEFLSSVAAEALEAQSANETSAADVSVDLTTAVTETIVEPSKALDESTIVSEEISETRSGSEVVETSGRRVLELDEYMKEQSSEGSGIGNEGITKIFEDYKFLLLALGISVIVILLLVGMVLYLFKDNKDNKGKS